MPASTAVDLALVEATFHAMGSSCRIVCDLPEMALQDAVHRIEDLEARWSRFRDDSETSRCNAAAGESIEVSAVTAQLITYAAEAWHLTDGRFDPLLLDQLEANGYDVDFPLIDGRDIDRASLGPTRASAADIVVDGATVRLPRGCRFDPGGIGKGLAADIVATELVDLGASWVLVSLGGDMRIAGDVVAEVGWPVVIENPWEPGSEWGSFRVHRGGVASSSTLKRCWEVGDLAHHHILDPATGCSVPSGRLAATVHSGSAWWSDVLAKCAVIDATWGAGELAARGASGFAFGPEGESVSLGMDVVRADG